jgi:hypothetical protein
VTRKPSAEKETSISATIAEYLDRRRIYHLRLNSGRVKVGASFIHLCPEGTPDRFCIYRGKPVFIEVKRPGEQPTTVQTETHHRIERAGGSVVVAYKVEDVIEAFRQLDRAQR